MGKTRGPIEEMVQRYVHEDVLRFHMPGHKGRFPLPTATQDVTEVPGTDSLFCPEEGIRLAGQRAAERWHAAQSFLLVNGSTAGVHAMILWAKAEGRTLFLPRDSHLSAVYACALADLQPVWLDPTWDNREQITIANLTLPTPIPGNSAVFLTYPDYYGRCVDLEALAERHRPDGAALLVDEAHGAHFVFSESLPPDAGRTADLWVAGAHKTLPAPTQTAFLHVRNAGDAREVGRLLRGITTTSPSYLLMAGLDNSRVFMEQESERLRELIGDCEAFAQGVNAVEGLRCWRREDVRAMGYRDHDPTRLVVDVRGIGLSGWEAGRVLRKLGLQAEFCDGCRVVLLTSAMDNADHLNRALELFRTLAAKRDGAPLRGLEALPRRGNEAMTIREAWLSKSAEVELSQAAGRVAAEPFGCYPPGIPLCMPGETIHPDAIDAARLATELGGGLFGVRDGRVLVVA